MTEKVSVEAAEEALDYCITAVLLRNGDNPHADEEYVQKAIDVLAEELDKDL